MQSLLRQIDRAMGAAAQGGETLQQMKDRLKRNAAEQDRVRREMNAHKNSIWQVERIIQLEQELASLKSAAPSDGGVNARARVAELEGTIRGLQATEKELQDAIANEEKKLRDATANEEKRQKELADAAASAEALGKHADKSDDSIKSRIQELQDAIRSDNEEESGFPQNSSYDLRREQISEKYQERTKEINELRRVMTTRAEIAQLDADIKTLDKELTKLYQDNRPTTDKNAEVHKKKMRKRLLETGR